MSQTYPESAQAIVEFLNAVYDAIGDLETDKDGNVRWAALANIQREVGQKAHDFAAQQPAGFAQCEQEPGEIKRLRSLLRASHQNCLALWEALEGGASPRCRDCADFNGRCQGSGPACEPQERAMERIRALQAALSSVSSTNLKPAPFYGAQCPSYPACSGGCGLGCTHEIERAKLASADSSPEGK